MNRLAVLLALAFAFVATAHAADLAPGLAYVRSADTTVIAKALETGSIVLDLRTVTEPVKSLRVPGKRLLFVLISSQTPAVTLPGAITVGRTSPDFKTDLTVTTTAESEAQVLAALATGTSPDKLIADIADKPRFDESTLVREQHAPGTSASPADETAPAAEPTPKPLVDLVLQRAVQVYQGLRALGKI